MPQVWSGNQRIKDSDFQIVFKEQSAHNASVYLKSKILEEVDAFRYLDSVVRSNNRFEFKIFARTVRSAAVFDGLDRRI